MCFAAAMKIVEVRSGRTNYVLTATRNREGDLVLSGADLSSWVKETLSTDEYEYFYVVKAAEVPRVCAALGATEDDLFDRIRALLAPHQTDASSQWKAWLTAQGIPFELSVWR
jgi:hypothetical protein